MVERLRIAFDRVLGCCVERHVRRRQEAQHGTDVENASAALRPHMRHDCAGHADETEKVGVEDCLRLLQRAFFSASGSDFNEVFVGVGAKRIRELFRQARAHKPAIVFIDEIDCLGKNRKFDQNGELQQTNNALLTAMDGFDSSEGVIVVAATNRPEDLDEALLRPGRFDRSITVQLLS